ncbi:protein phosphatase [Synechococcus sp. M16CYN]|uniref:protein phosphatase n=1 Tax=Synechococcus sp. M16CYN TaxID=3103139 RepID=UPI003249205C
MFTHLATGILTGAFLAAFATPTEAGTKLPVRWNTGGAVWSVTLKEFKTFFETSKATNRALDAGVNKSGWTSEEIRTGMIKSYGVDVIGVSRFLYSSDGIEFLKDQTASYFPYWRMKKTAVAALRSAIIADSIDGEISSAGIMTALPVHFRLADTCGTYTGSQNVCAPNKCQGDAQCTSLMSWYVFLPACIQANSQLPETAVR